MNIYVSTPAKLEIFTVTGQKVQEETLRVGTNNIDLSKLPNGVYFFKTDYGLIEKVLIEN
ncbi:MAG: hypothetical protein COA58_04270 [Bacteroidetes bacterium]|nr:MAG: hypothetical protein COA58_04270 [Bacteroidota bacterium]